MKKNLVLTGNIETFSKNEVNFLAGEWCKQFDKFGDFKKIEVLEYHWNKISKIKDDQIYLKSLYNTVLISLTEFLNKYHKLNHSKRYWEIIIGSWLVSIVCILFDRWECMQKTLMQEKFIKKINILNLPDMFLIPLNSDDFFVNKIKSHEWNHLVFYEVLKFSNKELTFNFINTENFKKKELKKKKPFNTSRIIDTVLKFLPQKKNIVLHKANFKSYYDKLIIYLKTGILIRKFYELEHDEVIYKKKRNQMSIDLETKNNFEKFLKKFLIVTMPTTFLENFDMLRKQTKKINLNPKIIFTAYAHFYDDFFKIWVAEKILSKSRYIICHHGGYVEKEINFNLWNNISDKTICWNKNDNLHPEQNNSIQMPPNFITKKSKFLKNKKSLGQKLLFLTYEVELYAHRIQDGPISSNIIDSFEMWKKTIKNLSNVPLQNIIIRHGPFRDDWKIKKKFENLLGEIKISKKKFIEEDFARSRVIVNTAMQTTFLESMKTGIPNILVLDKELWNLDNDMKILYDKLKSKNIIFTNAQLAGNHVNKIWNEPLSWWNSKEVFELRKEFSEMCSIETNNNLKEWLKFIKNENRKFN